MHLRQATEADIDAMFAVRTSVKENLLDEEQMRERGITRDSVREMMRGGLGAWVVEADGAVAGFAMGDLLSANVFALFVLPEHQGKGMGSILLQEMVNWFWRHGAQRITLDTGKRSRAVGFYEQHGWKKVELLASGEWRMELTRSQ